MIDDADQVYTVYAIDATVGGKTELVLCGSCIARGKVMVVEKKPNFRHACWWCNRTAPDLRPIYKPQCDCQPSIYRKYLGDRKAATGEQVPCICLKCVHCGVEIYIDYDWRELGEPNFETIHEGYK